MNGKTFLWVICCWHNCIIKVVLSIPYHIIKNSYLVIYNFEDSFALY
jgi:hypothetical protein